MLLHHYLTQFVNSIALPTLSFIYHWLPKRATHTYDFNNAVVGSKNLVILAHFMSSPRPTPRGKKCPKTNEEGPICEETLPRTILSLANQGHGRKEWHALKDSLPGRPKQKITNIVGQPWEHNRGAIPGESSHLRIKCPQLTSWPHLCGHDS